MNMLALVLLLIGPATWAWMFYRRKLGATEAWRALVAVLLGGAALVLAYVFVGGHTGNQRLMDLVDDLWEWNLLSEGRGFPILHSYDGIWHNGLHFWAWLCPPLVVGGTLLGLLEYLDSKSGLSLLERVKKLLWK